MRKLKKALSLSLAFALALTLTIPSLAITAEEQVIVASNGEVYDRILRALLFQPADEQAVLTLETDIQLTGFSVVLGTSDYGGMFGDDVYTIQPRDVVIDLNGHTITSEVDYPLFEVRSGYTLTIIDGSEEKTGALIAQGETDVVVEEGGKYVPLAEPEQPDEPAADLAYASTQNVLVDGKAVEFEMYALKDANGNDTNYIKLRDLALILDGTPAQFEVGWNGAVNLETGKPYTASGTEMSTPYSGDRSYQLSAAVTNVNGSPADLTAILLTDDAGSGYTYYQLRDLGKALGFNVGWSAEEGVFVETDKPYQG